MATVEAVILGKPLVVFAQIGRLNTAEPSGFGAAMRVLSRTMARS